MILSIPTTAPNLPPEFHSDLRAAFGDVGPRMILALRIVWPRLEEGIRIDEIARQLHVHRSTLLRWFQLDLGMSPQYAIMRLRLARAVRLVATTQAPLTEVAVRAGYCSFQSMARDFRASLQTTPSKVRLSRGRSAPRDRSQEAGGWLRQTPGTNARHSVETLKTRES